VEINPIFYRPAEVDILLGDSSKAREELGWQPQTNFLQLVKKMVDRDIPCSYMFNGAEDKTSK
jgi:GDPmannose 4,6-dehydratase